MDAFLRDNILKLEKEFGELVVLTKEEYLLNSISQIDQEVEGNNDLWSNPDQAKNLLSKRASQQKTLDLFTELKNQKEYFIECFELAKDDPEMIDEDFQKSLNQLINEVVLLKIQLLFDENDSYKGCFIEIHPGAGGVESHDWAEMLQRMYLRWVEKRNYKVEVISEQKGEEAGIKEVVLKISGEDYVYGWLKNEIGVHRLVRNSPFNSAGKRMTSFASVWVYPVINNDVVIDINESDLRIDTFRASGAGGQHVNTTDSAIRITHLPTSTVVQCQSGRSQHKNKEEAMGMLKAKLYQMEKQKQQQEKKLLESVKSDNSWGNQIRSYVLQPYQMVKDLRSKFETSNINGILNGELDEMIMSILLFHS